MTLDQLTLIQSGEFIVCDDIVYTASPPSLVATTSIPVNTMKAVAVRLADEMIPLPFIRSQDRRAVSNRIRLEGPIAARIAKTMGLAP